ncbi:hypothetical protein Pcinc_007476 [Petrolisthes cinctipes]|uniref:Uncharacterized protein n=1 Tax=Petrolisthes cinctipes TaxID=88211 RepID=A0AAE1G8D0_PETCI|nr:hypothetical protein Pcinc_007476 [Petrolisthes cinctipes]
MVLHTVLNHPVCPTDMLQQQDVYTEFLGANALQHPYPEDYFFVVNSFHTWQENELIMAVRRHQFQGQFGINETPLTTAIQNGDMAEAEEFIRANTDPSVLNDGAYENTPLHLVLTNNPYADNSRNLKLARMLVEGGADPNLRIIPYGDLDRDSPSPFEELVVYHEALRAQLAGHCIPLYEELEVYFECEEERVTFLTNTVDLEGVQCQPHLDACPALVRQTGELIQVFLGCGGDPNVVTTFGNKTLFHWVVEHEDLSLATRLLATYRVNLDQADLHGNTPLMDAILLTNPQDCMTLYHAMRAAGRRLDLNATNCCGETPLFRAAFVGAVGLAARMCGDGAFTSATVCLSQIPMSCSNCCDFDLRLMMQAAPVLTTPLLAPLLADAPARLRYSHVPARELGPRLARPHKHLIDKVVAAGVSPLVDLGCLTNVASHLATLLGLTNFQHLAEGPVATADLQVLMFGQLSAGLRQLCVRTIFNQLFPDYRLRDSEQPGHDYCGHDCEGALAQVHIESAMEALGLPQAFTVFYEAEAAKYQMCSAVAALQSLECDQACSASDDSVIDDTETDATDDTSDYYSSDYADFFSSDMLSEESSSEVDDLSEEEEEEESSSSESPAEGSRGAGKMRDVKPGRRKVLPVQTFTSESLDIQVVVETFCEDLVEDSIHPPSYPDSPLAASTHPQPQEIDHSILPSNLPLDHHNPYQRFNDESTESTASPCSDPPSPTKTLNTPTESALPNNLPSPTDLPTSFDPPSLSDPSSLSDPPTVSDSSSASAHPTPSDPASDASSK